MVQLSMSACRRWCGWLGLVLLVAGCESQVVYEDEPRGYTDETRRLITKLNGAYRAETRQQAAIDLAAHWEFPSEVREAMTRAACYDPDEGVKSAALEALLAHRAIKGITERQLKRLMRDKSHRVRVRAYFALSSALEAGLTRGEPWVWLAKYPVMEDLDRLMRGEKVQDLP